MDDHKQRGCPTMQKRLLCFVLLAGMALSTAADASSRADSPQARCDGLYRLTDESQAVNPGVLVAASGDTSAHCRVDGTIDGTIRFRVTMPIEGWTGRLMFNAPGGLAGVIGDTTSLLDEGFAMATTDSGHDGPNDPSFYRDDNAKINFGFRSNHLTAVLAKRIIAEFYGRDVEHAYLWGCSKGGHGALMEALRYPDDFDGIIAGAPAVDLVTGLLSSSIENARRQQRHPLTLEAVAVLEANTRRACDMLDGLADGLIGDPRQCTVERLELDKLECPAGRAADCLTAGQIETARGIYTGVTDASGEVVVPGVYPGAELGGDFQLWVTGPVDFLDSTANELTADVAANILHRQPGFSLDSFDTVAGMADLAEAAAAVHLPPPDFSRFMASGGKLIAYNGWHDMPCRAKALEDFYEEARRLTGAEAVDDFMRVFMVPGMVHCLGGPGAWAADYLQAIVDWVEKDQAPDRIIAQHPGDFTFMEGQVAIAGAEVSWSEAILKAGAEAGANPFTRPLCPYPQFAKYNGSGDVNDAGSFVCTEPPP
ncbi:MAG: tannase/feruloyl esterase family alpha/beta hydrolase [Gammaproteobacteria bacterium]|nr:tannase/feruloyl esterase family alpha/beta hydrolase [Gammaproteobacteria bacterium]